MKRLTAVSFVSLSPLSEGKMVRYKKNAGAPNSSSSLLSNFNGFNGLRNGLAIKASPYRHLERSR